MAGAHLCGGGELRNRSSKARRVMVKARSPVASLWGHGRWDPFPEMMSARQRQRVSPV